MRLLSLFCLLFALSLVPATSADHGDTAPVTELCMGDLAVNCRDCQYQCDMLIDYCLKKGGKWAAPERISILRDCSDISQLCSSLVSRHNLPFDQSKFAKKACQLCSDACAEVQASMTSLPPNKYVKNYLKHVADCQTICNEWWNPHRRQATLVK